LLEEVKINMVLIMRHNCCNPSFGLATKAKGIARVRAKGSPRVKPRGSSKVKPRGCPGVKARGSPGVTSHTPGSVRKC